jgi:hypothetical protein
MLLRTYPHPAFGNCDEVSAFYCVSIVLYQLEYRFYFFRDGHSDEPYDAWVWESTQENKFSEVFVLGYDGPLFFRGQCQNYFVGFSGAPFQDWQDVMALRCERGPQ